jgi:hypothetical protein
MTKDTTDCTTLDAQTAAEFIECANNGGKPIDWRGWVGNCPVLNATDAVRLMSGLEPNLHTSLETRRNEQAGGAKQLARKFERWAESQSMGRASPAQWLAWGERQGETVHIGFRLAVEQYAPESAPAAEAATIAGPGTPAKQWQAAKGDMPRKHELAKAAVKQCQDNKAEAARLLETTTGPLYRALNWKPQHFDDSSVASVAPMYAQLTQ